MARAHFLLRRHENVVIRIPEDVQNLVGLGNPGDFPNPEGDLLGGLDEAELERGARCTVEADTAKCFSIGPSYKLASLAGLSEQQIDE